MQWRKLFGTFDMYKVAFTYGLKKLLKFIQTPCSSVLVA